MMQKYSLSLLILSLSVCLSSMAATATETEDGTSAYLNLFKEKQKESAIAFQTDHPRLVDAWSETYQLQAVLTEMRNAFGTHRRKKAERMIPRTEAAAEKAYEQFMRYYRDAHDEYDEERLERKEEQLKLEERRGRYKSDSPSSVKLTAKIEQLNDEMVVYEDKLAILNTLKGALAGTSDSMDTVKHYKVNKKTFAKYAKIHPEAVEACHTVKDYYADIAELQALVKAGESDPQLPGILAKMEAGLEKAKEAMAEAIADAKADYERELERAKSDIEKLDVKIAANRERDRKSEREEKARAPLAERVQEIEEIYEFLDKMAAGAAAPEAKAEAAPKKKKKRL